MTGSPPPKAPPQLAEEVPRHQLGLQRYLRFLGARADLVDDLVQETFVRALAATFEWRTPQATSAWLRTIARNVWHDRCRRHEPHATGLDLDLLAATWEHHCGSDDGESLLSSLQRCLGSLRERQLQALRWRYRDDESIAAIGLRLGLGTAGADSLLVRTRHLLRRCLEAAMRG